MPKLSKRNLLIVVSLVVVVGVGLLIATKAATGPIASYEAEDSTLSGNAILGVDTAANNTGASGGKYIVFGNGSTTTTFQPTAPYYATFFYPWSLNPNTDGKWSYWDDKDAKGTHAPPANWFSNYLPDPNPGAFDPTNELYSSNNYDIFKWQAAKMAEAKQEVAISSWWKPGYKNDTALQKITGDFMARPDNPYPNLRWAFYYECEGNIDLACTNATSSNPAVSQITSDLNYIKNTYSNSPYMLRVNGKLVMFVYGDSADGGSSTTDCSSGNTDGSMTHRWAAANAQTGNAFYIVLKVFGGYATDPCQPDSWHQYAPAVRSDSQGAYSYTASPGFWKSGDAVRLPRDLSAFQNAVTAMVNSSAKWKLTETWNEWGEGSSVEPGNEVIQANGSTAAILNAGGAPFGNAYIQSLADRLPALEHGTNQ